MGTGTPPPSRRWSVGKLALLFYPFVVAAVAINLFMAGLVAQVLGMTALSPLAALIWSVPLGLPATWAAGRWIRRLMDQAESD